MAHERNTRIHNIAEYDLKKQIKGSIEWADNVLTKYENTSYYIKLFMVGDEEQFLFADLGHEAINVVPEDKVVVLAETGTTAFNIQSMTFRTVVAPNFYTRFSPIKELKIRIFEPGGFSLLDRLFTAANALGVRNFYKTAYFLYIKFLGYDELGNFQDRIGPSGVSRDWLYRIAITDIRSKFGPMGATHEIDAVDYNEVAFGDTYHILGRQFSTRKRKIRDIMNDFITAKEKEEKDKYGYVRNKYKVVIHELPPFIGNMEVMKLTNNKLDPGEWEVYSLKPESSQESRSPSNILEKESNFSKGQSLQNIMEVLFSNTAEGQALVRRSSETKRFSDENEFIIVWWLTTEVHLRKDNPYDYVREDYNREIIFHISPMVSTRGTASPDQQFPIKTGNTEKLKEKFDIRYNIGRLVKRYDYYWTGLNTEIIDLDISFDYLYKAILPVYGGNSTFKLNKISLIENDEYVSRRIEEGEEYNRLKIVRNSIEEQIKQINYTFGDELLKEDLLELLNNIKSKQNLLRNRDIRRFEGEQERQKRLEIYSRFREKFLEDIKTFSNVNPIIVSLGETINFNVSETKGNVEPEQPIEQTMTTYILNQLTGSKDLVSITMKIKGDPYWLGYSPLEKERYLIDISDKPGIPAFDGGEVSFLLVFMNPQRADNTLDTISQYPDEFDEYRKSTMYTGIYICKEVMHEFNEGIYTQTLYGVRDHNIDVNWLDISP